MAGKSIRQRVSDIEARVGASSQRSFGEELVSDQAIFDRLTVDAANGMAQQANNANDQIRNFGSRTETSNFNRARVTAEQPVRTSEQSLVVAAARSSLSVQERTAMAEQRAQPQTQQSQQQEQQTKAAMERSERG